MSYKQQWILQDEWVDRMVKAARFCGGAYQYLFRKHSLACKIFCYPVRQRTYKTARLYELQQALFCVSVFNRYLTYKLIMIKKK